MSAPPVRRLASALAPVLVALAVAVANPAMSLACSGPLPPARTALDTAPVVALVRVDAVRGPEHERGYDFAVEESFKGRTTPVLRTDSLPWHGCGDHIAVPAGTRLVIAFDARPFAAAPPLNPYWTITPDGRLEPEAIDDADLGWVTVDDLRAGMLARFGGLGSIEVAAPPGDDPDPTRPQPAGPDLGAVALSTLAGAGAVLLLVVLVARGRADTRR